MKEQSGKDDDRTAFVYVTCQTGGHPSKVVVRGSGIFLLIYSGVHCRVLSLRNFLVWAGTGVILTV